MSKQFIKIIALAVLFISMANANTIEQRISQVAEGTTDTGQFSVSQKANIFGAVAGENNQLNQGIDQYFHQDVLPHGSPFNFTAETSYSNITTSNINHSLSSGLDVGLGSEGNFSQKSQLIAVISGSNNAVNQSTSQVMVDNELHRSKMSQVDSTMALIMANNSVVNQSTSQSAIGNKLVNSALDQIASETAVILGNSSILRQNITQKFDNSTFTGSNQNQSANMRLLVLSHASQIPGSVPEAPSSQEIIKSTAERIEGLRKN